MPRRATCSVIWTGLGCLVLLAGRSAVAQGVDVGTVLGYKPTQSDVDYETPEPNEYSACKLEVERQGKGSGWLLYGPQGQVLRRFLDSDGDQRVDQYRYYKHGLEVYRDIDTNGNNEVDQCRWFNTGGSRWGVDKNEDGRIDSWKVISAEEASREAILALAARDAARLQAVLLTAEDASQVGLAQSLASQILSKLKDVSSEMQRVLSSTRVITPQSKWLRFDSSMLMPNRIPVDPERNTQELTVYENVMAIVDNDGQTGFVQIGEMIRIGDAWKLTRIPQPLEGERLEVTEGGLLMQPAMATAGVASSTGLSPKMQELIDRLKALDEQAPSGAAAPAELAKYNVARADLLNALADASGSTEERNIWLRQMIEGIAAATQMDAFPGGMKRLEAWETRLRQSKDNSELMAFVVFQRMLTEYNLELQSADPDERQRVQEDWLKKLQSYVAEFPKAENAPDALLQLAITFEFNGDAKQATTWYERLVRDYRDTPAGARGAGALRRLGLKGRQLTLKGAGLTGGTIDTSAYRGRVLAVVFWATWCKPCTEDLPQLQELYKTYQRQGFEVLGVNLDSPGAPIREYIQQYRVAWPHIHEEGGLESRPAVEFGVISLPTMFLVDQQGTVVSSSTTVAELKELVPELLNKK